MGLDHINKKFLFFDGAMGTLLQRKGLKLGEIPELYNFEHPETIMEIHRDYLEAGANFVTTNTFGANRYKIEKSTYSVAEVVTQAVKLAIKAKEDFKEAQVVLDIGSTGKMLKPIGDTPFEEIYEVFKEQVVAGEQAGCDLVLFETFTDIYELKAAILAAKENTHLPIFATMSFEESGRTFFGTGIEEMVTTLEGLGVTALGVNCSLGPKQLMPIVEKLLRITSTPVLLQPNAGLPIIKEGNASYDITEDEFAQYMREYAQMGVSILGGCCGTSPSYIQKMIRLIEGVNYKPIDDKEITAVCSNSMTVVLDDIKIVGERLNPTGKKLLAEMIRKNDLDYLIKEAMKQEEQGAHILDVNVGLPDIDEESTLKNVITELQSVTKLPLQIDSSNIKAIEAATRLYNGKPIINSVNGKKESLDAVLPIAKKYGACVIGLTLDENGIPETAEGRFEIAKKIVTAAEEIGIPKKNIIIDCLVLTASAQQKLVQETLKAVRLVKEKLSVKTMLGVSNVSFGLPNRGLLNKTMLALALAHGLDAAIMNPGDEAMTEIIDSFRVLMNYDEEAKDYIEKNRDRVQAKEMNLPVQEQSFSIEQAIIQGLRDQARLEAIELLKNEHPMDIIEKYIIPTLNKVGKDYEKQILFLPQLIKSAEAAQYIFQEIKMALMEEQNSEAKQEQIVLATVYGDIHDIGKNIVKVILENYNYALIDLGKDVPKEEVLKAVRESEVKLLGLSALMTTTVASMKETIELVKQECPWCKVVVGGAVLTEELAYSIGADYYAKDAMETVRAADSVFNR